jgi:DNA-binding MurR/RpiR family transcriptional regulator
MTSSSFTHNTINVETKSLPEHFPTWQNGTILYDFAKKNKIDVISFTGFHNPILKKLSKINFDVYSDNYGVSEDMFHIIMHIISQYLRQKLFKGKFQNKKF